MSIVKLESADGVIVEITLDAARQIGVFKEMFELCKIPNNKDEWPIIPLPIIPTDMLRLLVEWAEFCRRDPINEYTVWQYIYIHRNERHWIRLMEYADYLYITSLLKLLKKAIARRISQRNFLHLRQLFNLELANAARLVAGPPPIENAQNADEAGAAGGAGAAGSSGQM